MLPYTVFVHWGLNLHKTIIIKCFIPHHPHPRPQSTVMHSAKPQILTLLILIPPNICGNKFNPPKHRNQRIQCQHPNARRHRTPPDVLCPCLNRPELFWQHKWNLQNTKQVVLMLWLIGVCPSWNYRGSWDIASRQYKVVLGDRMGQGELVSMLTSVYCSTLLFPYILFGVSSLLTLLFSFA